MTNETEIRIVHDKTFDTIKSAVNKIVSFIKPTFGPAANKVIISKNPYKMVVDDGVQIARDFELSDPAENAIVSIIREAAIKTNDRVGDGTTGALLMLESIINEVSRKSRFDGHKVELELLRGLEEVKSKLIKSAKPIKTKEDLKKVALISFDNEKIATTISDLYFKLGKEGMITIDKSPTMETTTEMSSGIKIPTGYISPYMITNPERMETILEKPYILMTDYRITENNDIVKIMEKMAAENKRELVVICDNMESSALATAVVNRMQGKFLVVAVVSPNRTNRSTILEDMALMTGGKVFSSAKGDKLENAEVSDLGRAEKFICRRDESIIVGPKGSKMEMSKVVNMIKMAIESESQEGPKQELQARLATFTNSMAVIKVGAPTENERKALKYKVEDAVNATKSAFNHGVVCGSGLALARLKTSSPILNAALKYPAKQLRENMGMDDEIEFEPDEAQNVVTGEVGKFMEVGVIDPVDVLIAQVESAVSIASILLTSTGIIVESQKDKK